MHSLTFSLSLTGADARARTHAMGKGFEYRQKPLAPAAACTPPPLAAPPVPPAAPPSPRARYLFIQGGLRRGAGASAALGSLWAAARRGSLQAQPSPACASGFAGSGSRSFSHLQRLNKQTFVLIIAQKKPGCATNTTGFGLRSGGFPPDVLSDSRYAMSGLHHYTGKFKQKVPAGPRKWACG